MFFALGGDGTGGGFFQELEWSFRLFKEMRERGTVPNSVTCSALMDACLKSGEVDLAFAVLEHMLDVGIEPTEVCPLDYVSGVL